MVLDGARLAALILLSLAFPSTLLAIPSPAPLRFIAPTPSEGATVLTGTATVQLEAACTFDPSTLAISLDGNALPAGSLLPFASCSGGRTTSQPVVVGITLPNGSIASGPVGLVAGETGTFGASGTGDGFLWNFDGGAAPKRGAPVAAVFRAAGTFMVRLRATSSQALAASGLDAGNLVTAQRAFTAGDPTPDTREVSVAMPPEVDFRNYESAHVHPLALSAAGAKLYAVNTPEGRLAIFTVSGNGSLGFAGDVPVGLDPVSLAPRPGTSEVWVVNQISDSVSVVDTLGRKVVATLSVGDEPTDVVFAGDRAFVTLAGREDRVRIFDATSRAELASLELFGEDPRALAVNPAGTEVYAVVLHSGNRTTVVPRVLVTAGGGPSSPSPPRLPALGPAPAVALLVGFDPANARWEDETGGDWTGAVTYTLADQDMFVIDADAPVPALVRAASGVGTTLFDVAVHPVTGQLWVPNTDARNLVRFEPNLRGHLVETRVSRVTPASGAVTHVDLNPHIDYAATPGPPVEIGASLSQPGACAFTSNGAVFYLAAFGSAKVGVLDGTTGAVAARIDVGGGPSGLALNEAADRLYVLNRFDNTISTIDTSTNAEVAVVGVAGPARFDPSPDAIKDGRRFLYDAQVSSGHGDVSCATCHLFGDVDALGWDLGDPQGTFVPNAAAPWVTFGTLGPEKAGFDPMKGPMTTQTLRGLLDLEPFHWRGDRQNFQHFNGAFVSLLGRGTPVSATEMDVFTDFIMTLSLPPNPFRNLDDTLPSSVVIPSSAGGGAMTTGNAVNGWNTFNTVPVDGPFTCTSCHALPAGTSTNLVGTLGTQTQDLKIPQLRSIYRKVGFNPVRPFVQSGDPTNIGLAAQRSGFGLRHEGIVSLTEFMSFQFTMTEEQKRDIFAALLSFPTPSAPAIGRQVTVTATNKTDGAVVSTIATLVAQAETLSCGLVVKGSLGGTPKGWMYDTSSGLFESDSLLEAPVSESALRTAVGPGDAITYTGVPPGTEARLGIDRDRDTWRDRTETVLGTDPANPNSNPWGWAP
jgi:YVTN family beta-propeller protein